MSDEGLRYHPIKRHQQHIGRKVRYIGGIERLQGRRGTIKGFEGDASRPRPPEPPEPFCIIIFDNYGGSFTIRASDLHFTE